MRKLLQWLKWKIAREEMETLERYRLNVTQVYFWHCHHAPDVAEAARWVRQYSEPKDDPNDPPSGLSISALRGKIMNMRCQSIV